jgi:hypothetical protein
MKEKRLWILLGGSSVSAAFSAPQFPCRSGQHPVLADDHEYGIGGIIQIACNQTTNQYGAGRRRPFVRALQKALRAWNNIEWGSGMGARTRT